MQATAKNKGKGYGFTVLLFIIFFLFLKQLSEINSAVQQALALCARAIIPSLFPFLILTECLLSTHASQGILALISTPVAKMLRLSSAGGCCFLLGNLFGFPVGAKAVASYYQAGQLDKKEAERLLLFCGNASPFFLIGSVGNNMLGSAGVGAFLYFLQLLISLIAGLLSRQIDTSTRGQNTAILSRPRKAKGFTEIIQGCTLQTLYICGYILFFSAISAAILPYLKSGPLAALTVSLLEIGNACSVSARLSTPLSIAFCAFASSFSGLSVYFQTLDCLQGTDLGTALYLPSKLLMGSAAFLIAGLLY